LNDAGVVVGASMQGSTVSGFVWKTGKVVPVSPPKHFKGSWLAGIGDDGQVAGNACIAAACGAGRRAFAGSLHKGRVAWEQLPAPPGSFLCGAAGCDQANAIGRTGDISGEFANHAVLWQLKSNSRYKVRFLPETASRFTSSTGLSVDKFGDVAGTESAESTVGTFWLPGGQGSILPACEELLVRGGATFETPSAMYATGTAKKRTIHIVGQCLVEQPGTHNLAQVACVWMARVRGGTLSIADPVRLDGNTGTSGQATAVNGKGWISGNMGASPGGNATVWVNHQPSLLSALVQNAGAWNFGPVTGMNKLGQIVGTGFLLGQQRGFLLTPK
jgi:hypothetical protein